MVDDDRVSVFSNDNRANIPVYPLDVFRVTEAGTAQLNAGATRLPAEALEVLVLLDGKASVGDLEQKLPQVPPEALRDVLRALLGAKLVRASTIEESEGLDFSAFFSATAEPPSAGAEASAGREADTGGLVLKRDGYYVSIARHALKPRALAPGQSLRILLVDDDPDVESLVSRLLEGAGFSVDAARRRDEVVARLRQAPAPDLVLLDVSLPDTNGFDILARLKQHPVLRAIPVVMLTAEASREAVVRGLAGGADGYLTKPFSRQKLLAGVKAVLGLD